MTPASKRTTGPDDRAGLSGLTSLLLTVAAAGCSFTLVVPALPALATMTGAGVVTTSWILTGYLLASSVSTPILGRLGDAFGRRKVMGWTLSVMLVGMVVGSVADGIGGLIAARVIIGCGGGAVPLAIGIAYDAVAKRALSRAVGLLTATTGLGSVVGLALSAPLMHILGYRSLFWFPIPIVLTAVAFAWREMRKNPQPWRRVQARIRVGWAEQLLLAVWLTLPLLLLSAIPLGMPMWWAVGLLVVTAAAYRAWRWQFRRNCATTSTATLPPGLRLANVIGIALTAAMFGSYALLPLAAQHVLAQWGSGGVLEATFVLLPFEFGFLCASAIGGCVAGRTPRIVIVGGGLVAGLAFALLGIESIGGLALAVTGVLGAALGFAYPALALLILRAVPHSQVGFSLALNTNLRTIGGAVGSQVVAVLTERVDSAGASSYAGVAVSCAVLAVVATSGGALGLLVPRRVAALEPDRQRAVDDQEDCTT